MNLPVDLLESFTIPQLVDYIKWMHPELENEDAFPSMSSFWEYKCHDIEDMDQEFLLHIAMHLPNRTEPFCNAEEFIQWLASCEWSPKLLEILQEHLGYVCYRIGVDLDSVAVETLWSLKVNQNDDRLKIVMLGALLGDENAFQRLWEESEHAWAFQTSDLQDYDGKVIKVTRQSLSRSITKFRRTITRIHQECKPRSLLSTKMFYM